MDSKNSLCGRVSVDHQMAILDGAPRHHFHTLLNAAISML